MFRLSFTSFLIFFHIALFAQQFTVVDSTDFAQHPFPTPVNVEQLNQQLNHAPTIRKHTEPNIHDSNQQDTITTYIWHGVELTYLTADRRTFFMSCKVSNPSLVLRNNIRIGLSLGDFFAALSLNPPKINYDRVKVTDEEGICNHEFTFVRGRLTSYRLRHRID